MGRKGESITLSLKDYEKQVLEELAREYGMMWGDRPNISKLFKAIANKQILIAANHDWSTEKIEALDRISRILVDFGKIEEAKIIARILCDRSEINNPLRRKIENFLELDIPNWKQKLDSFITRQQPFKLVYQDASDRIWQYTVLYAKVKPIEKRLYLLCRCEETAENSDIKELQHNWSLRLDRIKEAELIEIDRNWENDLQKITVEFHLFERLALNYEERPEDISVEPKINEDEKPYIQVKRKIFSTFWFYRDIAGYWENCEIIAPDNVRQKFITEKLQLLVQKYYLH
ncbi:MAG: WYL domain-containing protein [Xenococcaceae cyanobacterium MO_188.B19]|nr:WYL domain-containing protein [Xenococcaceae cyanobacterium MO_188.B19]